MCISYYLQKQHEKECTKNDRELLSKIICPKYSRLLGLPLDVLYHNALLKPRPWLSARFSNFSKKKQSNKRCLFEANKKYDHNITTT